MNFTIIIFAAIFLGIYGAASYYIGVRGWQGLGSFIPFLNSRVYWILFWIVALSYLGAMLISRYISESVANAFSLVGAYWLAAMFYLLLLLPVIDIIRMTNKRFGYIPRLLTEHRNYNLAVGAIVLVGLTLLMAYGTWSGRSTKVSSYSIDIPKSGGNLKSLKVIMVSDVHLGDIMDNDRLTRMVDDINKLEPDIVLMPGDVIDNKLEPYVKQRMGENFRRLKSKYGVYASLGNHEVIARRVEDIVNEFSTSGIKVLRDEAISIGDSIYIAGRDDSSIERVTGRPRKELGEILQGTDKTKPVILLDHQPRDLGTVQKEGVDLQLSGHTHRGQFSPINLITSRIFEVDYGYLKKDSLNVVVSSGYGTWGPPIRIGSRSEIVEIKLNFK